jgi:hypothetical protein
VQPQLAGLCIRRPVSYDGNTRHSRVTNADERFAMERKSHFHVSYSLG